MVLQLQEFTTPHSADTALLQRAMTHWSDPDAFADDDVKAVKDLFRRAFNVEHELQGAAMTDALLLSPVEDEEGSRMRMYAMQVQASGEVRWVHWVLSDMWAFNMDVSLDTMLAILAMSELLHRERCCEGENNEDARRIVM